MKMPDGRKDSTSGSTQDEELVVIIAKSPQVAGVRQEYNFVFFNVNLCRSGTRVNANDDTRLRRAREATREKKKRKGKESSKF